MEIEKEQIIVETTKPQIEIGPREEDYTEDPYYFASSDPNIQM